MKYLGWAALAGCLVSGCQFTPQRVGDRNATGTCPDGETCSPSTPSGLVFQGVALGGTLGGTLPALALGGTQRVRFFDARGETNPLVTHRIDIDEAIVALPSVQHGSAQLEGRATGSTFLRIVDLEGQLLDRTEISVMPITSVRAAAPALVSSTRRFVYAPGSRTVHAGLFGATGERLVDDSLRFEPALSSASFTVSAWDTITLQMPSTNVTIAGRTAAGPFTFLVEAAGAADDIAVNEEFNRIFGNDDHEELTVAPGGILCFELLSSGATIVGADQVLQFRVDGSEQPAGTDTAPCVALPESIRNTTTIEVTAGEITRSFVARVE